MAQMVGGMGPQKTAPEHAKELAEVQAVCDQVRDELESKLGKTFSEYVAISFKSQVVAGTNFFVKIHIGNEEYIHVRIFRPLPHTEKSPSVAAHELGKKKDDEIVYIEH